MIRLRDRITYVLFLSCVLLVMCRPKNQEASSMLIEGTFAFDRDFLEERDDIVVLRRGEARLIVSPRYQGKVFTSSATGDEGQSFGWVNYKAFGSSPDAHMNAFGGENRFWLGPEGNAFSLFFKQNAEMTFENWFTPPPIDIEPWTLVTKSDTSVALSKAMTLLNYAGTRLEMVVEREIGILTNQEIQHALGITLGPDVQTVGYRTDNVITNTGEMPWTRETGAPCIWMLDMFVSSPRTVVMIPIQSEAGASRVTADYFGQIPPERLRVLDSLVLFRADGRSRGKIGVSPGGARPFAGSYDFDRNVLTVVTFDLDPDAVYLNQEWTTSKDPFAGDAVNAYNDGPLEDGSLMGPFYELESVSPAAFLQPGDKLTHRHTVFHFTGDADAVRKILTQLFGSPVDVIERFVQE